MATEDLGRAFRDNFDNREYLFKMNLAAEQSRIRENTKYEHLVMRDRERKYTLWHTTQLTQLTLKKSVNSRYIYCAISGLIAKSVLFRTAVLK